MPSKTFPNGQIPASELAPVHGGGRMLKQEAALLNAMSDAYVRAGHARPAVNGSISGYRDLPGQVAMRNSWCARGACQNAAVPGTSNHGRGHAGDINPAGIAAAQSIGPRHGISKAWSDAPWEPWHHLVEVTRAARHVLDAIQRAADPWSVLSDTERKVALELRRLRRAENPRTRRRRRHLRAVLVAHRRRQHRYAQRHGWTARARERYAVLLALTTH